MTHITREVELFGPPYNFDGRTDESSHKDTTKCPHKIEQRKNMFDQQTGYKRYENLFNFKDILFYFTILQAGRNVYRIHKFLRERNIVCYIQCRSFLRIKEAIHIGSSSSNNTTSKWYDQL